SQEGRPRILYVEDDLASAALVQRVLAAEGYEVVVVGDGITALEVAPRTRPSLILMDINISGLDGYEVTTRLRSLEEMKQVPIIALTAAALKGDRERALIAGCDGYIPKPIDVDRLPEQVQAFLSGMRERVESPEVKAEYLTEYSRRLVEHLEGKIRELQQAHAELQHIDKIKTDFVILASHELRTPLTAIYGYIQILLSNPDIPGPADEVGSPRFVLQRMAEASKRLSQAVEDILNVSLIDADKLDLAMRPVFLEPIVHSVVRNITGAGPDRELEFEVEGLSDLPPVMGDSQRLYQALWNVLSNAAKYTPDGGTIRISGRIVEQAAYLNVQDTGIGIDPKDQERIFDRFYVLEDTALHRSSKTAFKGGGLGLGLTVARGLIEAHGGRIWVESEGRDEKRLPGSTFHILLPPPQQATDDQHHSANPLQGSQSFPQEQKGQPQ
ncbi:MAG TPA: hybrid sensor histidine kinase/response regulator, partial [Anaerolineae bacterium]|nr:hybrid sensor histidine kinase/response regulator [Anaerolineae bacterium]